MAQLFWKRWSLEYLPQLHRRSKWVTPSRPVTVGELGLLKEENLATMKWKLTRVEAVHPGADNVVRVITLRTSDGTLLKRPVAKFAVLPRETEEEANGL